MVPPIVGAVVFILVGLYMMYCGRNGKGSSAETKPVEKDPYAVSRFCYRGSAEIKKEEG
jgi:hypothetical protein